MGGISAFYPSKVRYHYVSPYIPKGHDTFGEVLREAHARGIRVIGRFDLSKTHKDAYDAHPEWFFKKANGEPAVYNGLYQACINGGWYRQKAVEILTEALDRYDVDGLFFNMFSNPSSDYSGNPLGICHCDNCQAAVPRPLPSRPAAEPDRDYQQFLHDATRDDVGDDPRPDQEQAPERGAGGHLARDHATWCSPNPTPRCGARCPCGPTPPATT